MNRHVRDTLVDVCWGALWALMLVAVVVFFSGASDFIYIDF